MILSPQTNARACRVKMQVWLAWVKKLLHPSEKGGWMNEVVRRGWGSTYERAESVGACRLKLPYDDGEQDVPEDDGERGAQSKRKEQDAASQENVLDTVVGP